MFRNVIRIAVALAILAGSQSGLGAQGAYPPTAEAFAASEQAQRHVAAAMALAGSDLVDQAKAFCTNTGPRRDALVRRDAGLPPIEDYVVEPVRVFENLYFIGFNDVGAWAIETSDGLILIDALNTPDEARDVLVPGLVKMGLDPAQIKYVVIGHGHNDHVGGASYLQDTYGARILISGPDWDLALSGERPDRPRPTRDMVVTHGQKLTLGDTTLTLALTPGHTEGSLAMFIPVKHRGGTHTAMIFSGTTMPNQEALAGFTRVFDDIARPLKTETAMGGHPGGQMNKLEVHEALRQGYPDGPHPLLIGEEPFSRYLSIMLECASARLAAME